MDRGVCCASKCKPQNLDEDLTSKMYFLMIPRRIALAISVFLLLPSATVLRAQTEHISSVSQNDMPDAPSFSGQQESPASSSSTAPAAATPPATTQKTQSQQQHDQAAEDLKKEEKQRILGVMPDFNMIDNADAPPLSPKQKFHLMWKSSTDPFIFLTASINAGIGQAKDSNPGYGQGAQGYFKRFGASYTDTFSGNFWGNAVLKIQDISARERVVLGAACSMRRYRPSGVGEMMAHGGRTMRTYREILLRVQFPMRTIPPRTVEPGSFSPML
jgi:hypothetical protein